MEGIAEAVDEIEKRLPLQDVDRRIGRQNAAALKFAPEMLCVWKKN